LDDLGPVDLWIFDLDGTLVDSSADIAAAANQVLAGMGRPTLPDDEIRRHVGDGSVELMRRCLGDGSDPSEAALEFRRRYREHPCGRSSLYPGVREFLAASAPTPIALVTNKPLPLAVAVLEGLGIAGRFDPVLGERSLPRNKPHPDAIRFALEMHRVDPSRAVMVGDSVQDLAAGRGAGVRTVAVRFGYGDRARLEDFAPDAAIDSIGELLRGIPGVAIGGDGADRDSVGRDPAA
jgi:phosphoglycolate phosphatase